MKRDPPWVSAGLPGRNFTVPALVTIADLHGDIVDPQLVIFFGGNQFMVTHDLIAAFQRRHPEYSRIYWQTLPPGIQADQVRQGALVIGNLRVALRPDVFTAGSRRIDSLGRDEGWFDRRLPYAANRLAIMVARGNPEGIGSLEDLGGEEVRVSLPNPRWEGIGRLVERALREAGGDDLVRKVTGTKVSAGTTFLTAIHHRQTPLRIMDGVSDCGPVWRTETLFQQRIGNPVEMVEIPERYNRPVTLTAASFREAPHARAAADFLDFLAGEGQAIYREYGFLPAGGTERP